ncbi:MAG: NAD-dependent deacylase [Bacteroidales bacterium]|nr:NAD-dependent deacylase [Bacteroidales bacterium]
MKAKLVVLSGAGISAESGIRTFRDSDGLWENYRVEDVASIDGWYRDPEMMTRFYNERRAQLEHCQPNAAHVILADLEVFFNVVIITQNVDNLHERAGSKQVIHLHGELTKACSEHGKKQVHDIGYRAMKYGERGADGALLRPFIVWFGEDVPMLAVAIEEMQTADHVLIIGTSLNVYPAASLYHYAPKHAQLWMIDPNDTQPVQRPITHIRAKATEGMKQWKNLVLPDNL